MIAKKFKQMFDNKKNFRKETPSAPDPGFSFRVEINLCKHNKYVRLLMMQDTRWYSKRPNRMQLTGLNCIVVQF